MINRSNLYNESIRKVAEKIPNKGGTVLVTGASGLIGSCIVDVLIEANRLFDKKYNVYVLGRNREKLNSMFGNYKNVYPIVQDIAEPIVEEHIDYIIHSASNADPKSYAIYPAETILTNIIGAKNILEYCKAHINVRALLTSSFEVYGKLDKDEYFENDYGIVNLDLIRSCYPESKRTAEMLFKSYYDEYGVDCVIARLSSVYGPNMKDDDSKAHAQFLRNATEGKNIVLKSKGTQKRTYCYVMDAVSGIFSVLFNGQPGEAYNVANEESIATIAEVAQTIANLSGTKVIYDTPDRIEEKGFSRPQNCILKTDKLKSLGWSGAYDLKTGIKETLDILRRM